MEWNNNGSDYIDKTEEDMIRLLSGKVLDIGCGINGRSSHLIAKNPAVKQVVGFDPEIQRGVSVSKVILINSSAECWNNWEGFNWIVSFYNSLDYIKPENIRQQVLDKVLMTRSNLLLTTHKRFVIPKSFYRLRWNYESLTHKYCPSFNGGTWSRSYRPLMGLERWKITSNMEYWIRNSRGE